MKTSSEIFILMAYGTTDYSWDLPLLVFHFFILSKTHWSQSSVSAGTRKISCFGYDLDDSYLLRTALALIFQDFRGQNSVPAGTRKISCFGCALTHRALRQRSTFTTQFWTPFCSCGRSKVPHTPVRWITLTCNFDLDRELSPLVSMCHFVR